MPQAINIILFVVMTVVILWVSWPSLRRPWSRGFYRTFVFEFILIMFLLAVESWFVDPLSLRQIISWLFLIDSLVMIIGGVRMFYTMGKISREREDDSLVGIEKTTELVTTGIYRFIRHPFYSSLLFLSWGIFFKEMSGIAVTLAAAVTVLLVVMAKMEEKENLQYFGEKYQIYMETTKMFIPYLV